MIFFLFLIQKFGLGFTIFEIITCVISYYDNKMSKQIVYNSIFLEGHKKQPSK